jgi:hypothetical protein
MATLHTCDQCRQTFTETPVATATRSLCPDCGAKWMGAAASIIGGGSIGEAIATEGWFQKLRRRRLG